MSELPSSPDVAGEPGLPRAVFSPAISRPAVWLLDRALLGNNRSSLDTWLLGTRAIRNHRALDRITESRADFGLIRQRERRDRSVGLLRPRRLTDAEADRMFGH